MKNTLFKRLLSAVLSMAMVLSIVAMPVMAEEAPASDDIVIYYDDSASGWGQVFLGWTDPHAGTSAVEEIFDANMDGLYEVQICADSTGVSFGPSADIGQHLLWLDAVTDGGVYRYIPPVAEGPEVTEEPTEPEATEEPTEPEVTEEPTKPEVTEEPTEPEVTEEPTEPEVTEEPTEPEVTEEPTEPEATEEPTEPEVTEEATEPEATEEPTEPEATEEPTEPEVTEEPTRLEAETSASAVQYAPDTELPGNDELFAYYTEDVLYGNGMSAFSTNLTAYEQLNAIEKEIYTQLVVPIEAVAGFGGNTRWDISTSSITGLKTAWTNTELGVASIEDTAAAEAAFMAQFDLGKILAALAYDCPLDLYWYDKDVGVMLEYIPRVSGYSIGSETVWDTVQIQTLTFTFAVSADYSSGANTVTSNVARVTAAKNNASQVVAANAGLSAREKLQAYKNYICGAVSYDQAAADDPATPYGDQWQLIYVFDGDSSTNVVCEGYAKAFQYLCDLSGLDCIMVDGTMSGGTGAGLHMWNIVTLDGINYLVDITNCDAGSVGEGSLLFLAVPAGGSMTSGYSFDCAGTAVNYSYSQDVLALYPASMLDLGAGTAGGEEEHTHNYVDGVCSGCGAIELIASGTCGTALTWKLSTDGVLTISGQGSMPNNGSSYAYGWNPYYESVTAVVIESGVTSIGDHAFECCYNMTSITIPEGVASIGTYAFSGCEKLAGITLPAGVTGIGDFAFWYCESLAYITLPGSLSSIGEGAFFGCRSLTNISIPAGVTAIADHTFNDCQSLTGVTLPDSLTDIGDHAFFCCYQLTDITIPAGVTGIGDHAFEQCFALPSVNIPNGVSGIGEQAFYGCRSLTTVTIPSGVTGVGAKAFYGCSNLTTATIPASVTGIGTDAFYACSSIEDVFYGGTSDQWSSLSNRPEADLVHYSCTGWATVTVAPTCTESGSSREACSCGYERNVQATEATGHKYADGACSVCGAIELIASGTHGSGITWELDVNGTLTISGQGNMTNFYNESSYEWAAHRYSVKSIVITDGITGIGHYAFTGYTNLKSVTIGNGVTVIGTQAFAGCTSLQSATIGDSVSIIDDSAFSNCPSLQSITIPASVTVIGTSAFMDCSSLSSITIPGSVTTIGNSAFARCTGLSTVIIREGVSSIGDSAFSHCSAVSYVSLPKSVTGIGTAAFRNCTRLSTVFYGGTEAQKANITIGSSYNEDLTSVSWHYSVTEVVQNGKACYRCGKCGLLYALDGSYVSGGIVWELTGGVLTFSGNGSMADYASETGSPWNSRRSKVKSVVIGDGITNIGNYAFSNFTALTSVSIPDTVTTIGAYAFKGCSGLTTITIPDSVTSIGDWAFNACSYLTTVFYEGTETQKAALSIGARNTALSSAAWHYEVTEETHDGQLCYRCGKCGLLYAADGGLIPEGPTWTLENGVLTISGNGPMEDYEEGDAPWYPHRFDIFSVVITDGITGIGGFAFYNCTELTGITIPCSVTDIGNYAFYGCFALTDITIPNSVTGIGTGAFIQCSSLKSISIPASITDIGLSAFSGCDGIEDVFYGGTSAQWEALSNRPEADFVHYSCAGGEGHWETVTTAPSCTEGGSTKDVCACGYEKNVKEAAPATGIHSFKDGTCTGCGIPGGKCGSTLTWMLKDGVLTISGSGVMYRYSYYPAPWYDLREEIREIVLLNGITAIGSGAFEDCSALTSVTIPDSVTEIPDYSFMGCSSLKSITIPGDVTRIGESAFENCSSLSQVTIPGSVDSIGTSTFENCDSLSSINIPYGVTSIGDYAFMGCASLTNITLPASLTGLGERVFSWCSKLSSITIPDKVTGIGFESFEGCSSLSSVIIGNSVTCIGNEAFASCSSLTEIIIPDSVISISGGAFEGCTGLTSVTLGEGITAIGNRAFYNCSRLDEITIPDSVISIGDEAFYGCSAMTSVDLGEGVSSIGHLAFGACSSLTGITIPDSVTSIGNEAFEGCTGMTNVTIGNGLTTISLEAFSDCSSLTGVIIGTNVSAINFQAFSYCSSLSSITIPGSVTKIEGHAFTDCNDIEDVFFGGTAEQWAALSNRPEADFVHYSCTGGEGHWETVTTAPNCTEAGSTREVCACGYERNVVAIEATGHTMTNGVCSVCGEGDPSAIQAPTLSVSNVASTGKIKLSWNAVDGAAQYKVYRATGKNGTYSLLTTVTGTQVTNTSVTVGTTYYYYVEAVSELGTVSAPSNTVSRTCDLPRPTVTVTNIASSGKPRVSWTAVTGATKYTLYIYDASGSLLKSTTTTGTALTHNSAEVGVTYTYKVKALCGVSAATSAFSEAKSCTCDLAQPVLSVTNVASTGKNKISWNAVSGATKYTLYIYDANGNQLKTSSTTGTSITHTSAEVGVTYTYKVKASCSVSAATSAFSEAKSRTCDLPRTTVTVSNIASSGKIRVSWNAVSGATKYTLYIYDADGNQLKATTTTGTALTHSSAAPGTTYTYKVKALCDVSAATSAFSEAKSRTCDLPRPTVSVALNANGKPVLTWAKVSGATMYTVYVYDANGELLKTSSTTGTKLTHNSAASGTAYSYRVVAVSSVSAANSAKSTAVSVQAR